MIKRLSTQALLCLVILFISCTESNKLVDFCPELAASRFPKIKTALDDPSKKLGSGGFGVVIEFDQKALKILRLSKKSNAQINDFVYESNFNKILSQKDTEHVHFPEYFECFVFRPDDAKNLISLFEEPAKPASINLEKNAADNKSTAKKGGKRSSSDPILTKENSLKEEVALDHYYVGVLMQKAGEELKWVESKERGSTDLLDRVDLLKSMAFHMKFLNDTLQFTHCDIKLQNFLMAMVPRNDNGSLFPTHFKRLFKEASAKYISKLIDFGAMVQKNNECKTISLGYMPPDNMALNTSRFFEKVNSDKNDIYAVGTLVGHFLTDSENGILKIGQVINKIMLDISIKEIEIWNKDQIVVNSSLSYEERLQMRKTVFIKYKEEITPLLVNFKPNIMRIYNQLSSKSIGENELVTEVISDPEMLTKVFAEIHKSFLQSFKKQRENSIKEEILKLLYSLDLSVDNFKEYATIVQDYMSVYDMLYELAARMMSFEKNLRPDWDWVIGMANQLEARLMAIYGKLSFWGLMMSDSGVLKPDYSKFSSFSPANLRSANSIQITNNMRILTESNPRELEMVRVLENFRLLDDTRLHLRDLEESSRRVRRLGADRNIVI